jgi:hypothetical protein
MSLLYLPSLLISFPLSFSAFHRVVSALSGSASLLSGSLSKIFRSFLTHPVGCLVECENPRSLRLLKGESEVAEEKSPRVKSNSFSVEKDCNRNSKAKKSKSGSHYTDSTRGPGSYKNDRYIPYFRHYFDG